MVRVDTEFGSKTTALLTELSLDQPGAVKQRGIIRIFLYFIAACCITAGFLGKKPVLAACSFFPLALTILVKHLMKQSITGYYKKADPRIVSGRRTYEFTEEGVHIVSDMGEGQSEWSAFTAHGEKNGMMWISRIDNQFVLVEKAKLGNAELAELLGYLAKIGK